MAGHYEVVRREDVVLGERVGVGVTAEVFRATYRGMDVAIKQIMNETLDQSQMSEKEQQAVEREISVLLRVNHPNLVKFIGLSPICMGQPFQIVTEFCAGGCVFALLHENDQLDLTYHQQVKMCVDVAKAMDYLHKYQPQIIHRDLKSLNLLLAAPVNRSDVVPFVKVSDFGLSRMKDGEWGKMTIAAGTSHWMAPEVYSSHEYTEKVDVFSYGMILFEIVCREIPFEEEEPAQVAQLTCTGHRPDLDAVPPDCPPELAILMTACWQTDPRSRPDFQTILEALERLAADLPAAPG